MNIEIKSPFPLSDAARVWAWTESFRDRIGDDFSPKDLPAFLAFFRQTATNSKTWAVYRDGELGGLISYSQLLPVVGTAHCVFKRSFWGSKTTIPAIQQAVAEMWEYCDKLSLPVLDGNLAMISLLKKVGAVKEGILRGQTRRAGKPLDVILLALFKPVSEVGPKEVA